MNKQKTNKTKRGEWAPLTLLVWSSVTMHTAGRNEEHADEDKLKITVFNLDKQGKTRQGRRTGTPGSNKWTRRKGN